MDRTRVVRLVLAVPVLFNLVLAGVSLTRAVDGATMRGQVWDCGSVARPVRLPLLTPEAVPAEQLDDRSLDIAAGQAACAEARAVQAGEGLRRLGIALLLGAALAGGVALGARADARRPPAPR